MTSLQKLWKWAYLGTCTYDFLTEQPEMEEILLNYWSRVACPELEDMHNRLKAKQESKKRLPK